MSLAGFVAVEDYVIVSSPSQLTEVEYPRGNTFALVYRNIHLNPLRAGMVPDLPSLDLYPWCGHSELVGTKTRSIIKIDEVLALFDRASNKACKRYRSFLADGCPPGRFSRCGKQPSIALNPDLGEDVLFDERILGGGSFVEKLLEGKGH